MFLLLPAFGAEERPWVLWLQTGIIGDHRRKTTMLHYLLFEMTKFGAGLSVISSLLLYSSF